MNKIFSYSIFQFLFNVICFFSRNLDKLMIGKHMGMIELGYYEKSYRLMMLPLQNITQVITPVMHPIFSDFQDDLNKLAGSYERIVRLLAFIGFPLSILLYFTASEAVLIIFGDQWHQSISVFRILALSVGVQIVLSSSGSIFQASYDTKSLFICGLFSAVLNIAGFFVGIFYFDNLDALACCIVISFSINFIQCYLQMYVYTFKRNIKFFIKQLLSPFLLSIILVIVLYPLSILIEDYNIFPSLILKGIASILVFGLYIQLTHEYDIILKFRNLIGKLNNKAQ